MTDGFPPTDVLASFRALVSSVRRPVAALVAAGLLALAPPVTAQDSTAVRFTAGTVEVADSARTEVLVLGTPHLASIGPRFRPVMVERLVDTLEAYAPSAIAVESLPPGAIAEMQQLTAYDSVLSRFAGPQLLYGQRAQTALGIGAGEAAVRADSLLEEARAANAPAGSMGVDDRLHLVQFLLAAYRHDSAALQWSYLPDSVRRAQTVVGDSAARYFAYRSIRAHEIDAVAIRLARRLELQRVVPIDDHREKDILFGMEARLRRQLPVDSVLALQEFAAQVRDRRSRAVARGDLLPFYRYINSDAFLESEVRRQWLFYYRTGLASGLDRSRAALWETRNLLMAAHIRRLTARHPGERVLVLVGASHKPFLDAYLQSMIGVERTDLADLLKRSEPRTK
jgi:hypothetical protein